MNMRQKKIIEQILCGQKGAEPSRQVTDMVYSLCLVIDGLLQEADRKQTWKRTEGKILTGQVNIAIDGPCGGGKTTLANILEGVYDCNLFHMDDFFLRAEQRMPLRYQEPGGNVDYERFRKEVLDHLSDKEGLQYRKFRCEDMCLGESRRVPCKKLNIIEGSYSCHPYFGEDAYTLRLFVDVEPDRQRERIIARSGETMWKRFAAEWIPMENRYFNVFGIREKCRTVEMCL